MRIIHIKRTRSPREWLRAFQRSLNHWEKWANAGLGGCMKNPMCRQRMRARHVANDRRTATG